MSLLEFIGKSISFLFTTSVIAVSILHAKVELWQRGVSPFLMQDRVAKKNWESYAIMRSWETEVLSRLLLLLHVLLTAAESRE